MSVPFVVRVPLRFAHCDPAGIAYYPRYFELADGVIEDWTEQVVGVPRRVLHLERGLALPTVALTSTFAAVSRLGDALDFRLTVERLGTSSIDLALDVRCGDEHRFAARYTQVLVETAGMRAIAWPAPWRERIEETMA